MLVDKKPIFDERVNEILRGLVAGKTRDELAMELGHKSYKSLDIYMRRKHFMWDREKQNYVPAHSRIEKQDLEVSLTSSSKVSTVISLFQKQGTDARTIARMLGFSNHRELAAYMKGKGYIWSSDAGNYVKVQGRIESDDYSQPVKLGELDTGERSGLTGTYPLAKTTRVEGGPLERFLPLLDILEKNREKVLDLLLSGTDSGKVPRYAVPGVFVTKSVHMTNTLDQLVREYSREKNISQRDIFAVALIEFFRRYGYEREIDTLLGRT